MSRNSKLRRDPSSDEEHGLSLLELLHRAQQSGERIFGMPGDVQLTPRQHSIMQAIHLNPGSSQSLLVQTTVIDRSTLSEIMRRLTRRGWVERRRRRDDRRAFGVQLTAAGEAMLQASQEAAREVESCLADAVGRENRDELARMLVQIASLAERKPPARMTAAVLAPAERVAAGPARQAGARGSDR